MSKHFVKLLAPIGLCLVLVTSDAIAQETLEQFLAYQEDASSSGVVSDDATSAFYKRSFAFWVAHAVEYNANPAKFEKVRTIYHQNQEKYKRNRTISMDRYEDTIEQYRRFDKRNTLAKNPVLFVGSSSIVFWETAKAFPEYL